MPREIPIPDEDEEKPPADEEKKVLSVLLLFALLLFLTVFLFTFFCFFSKEGESSEPAVGAADHDSDGETEDEKAAHAAGAASSSPGEFDLLGLGSLGLAPSSPPAGAAAGASSSVLPIPVSPPAVAVHPPAPVVDLFVPSAAPPLPALVSTPHILLSAERSGGLQITISYVRRNAQLFAELQLDNRSSTTITSLTFQIKKENGLGVQHAEQATLTPISPSSTGSVSILLRVDLPPVVVPAPAGSPNPVHTVGFVQIAIKTQVGTQFAQDEIPPFLLFEVGVQLFFSSLVVACL